MPVIQRSLFKKYDIRGVASGDSAVLTTDTALLIGRSIGTYLQRLHRVQRVVVGQDNRLTSPTLQKALMEGLVQTGLTVVDLGVVSTPLVYWHAVHAANCGGVMVTGSHLAPHYNGFKLCVGAVNLYDQTLQTIADLIESDDFEQGAGIITEEPDAIARYVADLAGRVHLSESVRIVVDAGNGTAGLIAPPVLHAWGQADITGLYLEPDGTYPNHAPNPQEPENMRALADAVRRTGADIGFAFDGDADRVGVVDERGQVIVADRLLALLARDLLTRHPGTAVVGEVLCSQVLFDTVTQAGGQAIMAPSGHSIVKDVMREQGALLGGEMSGHIFLGEDYSGVDDAFLVMGRVLQLMENRGRSIGQLDDELPRLFSTPEYRPHCADADKNVVLSGMAAQLEGAGSISTVDGVRVTMTRGWGIVRASNTEPVLSLRFEGATEADALACRQVFMDALRAFPQVAPLAV